MNLMTKRIKLETWDMSLEQFISLNKCHNFKQYTQFTSHFSRKKQIGCHYYIYISLEDMKVINPYSKKYKGEKYKSFFSSVSSDDCKTKAWQFIQEKIEI